MRRHVLARDSSSAEKLGLLGEDAHERRPVRQQGRERVHLLERRDVALVEAEQALPGVERAARIVAAAIVELRERGKKLLLRQPLDGLLDLHFS